MAGHDARVRAASVVTFAATGGDLPDRAHLLNDPDLVSVRHKPRFQERLAGL
jgi:hypothetical protein